MFLGPSHRSGRELRQVHFEEAPPGNSDANGKQTTFQDRLLKGLTEWQEGRFQKPMGGFGDNSAHVTRAASKM